MTQNSANNVPHRKSLAEISHRRIEAVKSKGIYVLPNAFTAAALFAAFYGIIQDERQLFGGRHCRLFLHAL